MEINPRNVDAPKWLEFKPSRIHGMGAFAREGLKHGVRVIEYVGEIIDKSESLKRCEADNAYIFMLDAKRDLDGSVPWNFARFINHSCFPNCDAEMQDGQIWITARKDIEPDAEITINYGYDLEDYRQYPCYCGSEKCIGYMVDEEFFPYVRRQMELVSDGTPRNPRSSSCQSSTEQSI
jgi:SET domain-containing protein